MPMTTYLLDEEATAPCGEKVLDELLEIVRTQTGKDWRISSHPYVRRTGWLGWKKEAGVNYCLYCELHRGEFQIINFYGGPRCSSIHTLVSPLQLAAYLDGILAGYHLSFITQQGTSS